MDRDRKLFLLENIALGNIKPSDLSPTWYDFIGPENALQFQGRVWGSYEIEEVKSKVIEINKRRSKFGLMHDVVVIIIEQE